MITVKEFLAYTLCGILVRIHAAEQQLNNTQIEEDKQRIRKQIDLMTLQRDNVIKMLDKQK